MNWDEITGKEGKVFVNNTRGRRYPSHTTVERAKGFVREGLAIVKGPALIQVLFEKDELRPYVLSRDNYVCHYCGREADTIDHRIPVSMGGLDTPLNCVAACRRCNWFKEDIPYDRFVAEYPKELLIRLWEAVDLLAANGIKAKIRGVNP